MSDKQTPNTKTASTANDVKCCELLSGRCGEKPLIIRIWKCATRFKEWRAVRTYDKVGMSIKDFDEDFFYNVVIPQSLKNWEYLYR